MRSQLRGSLAGGLADKERFGGRSLPCVIRASKASSIEVELVQFHGGLFARALSRTIHPIHLVMDARANSANCAPLLFSRVSGRSGASIHAKEPAMSIKTSTPFPADGFTMPARVGRNQQAVWMIRAVPPGQLARRRSLRASQFSPGG